MITLTVSNDEELEKSIKKFSGIVYREGTILEFKKRQFFEKPSKIKHERNKKIKRKRLKKLKKVDNKRDS